MTVRWNTSRKRFDELETLFLAAALSLRRSEEGVGSTMVSWESYLDARKQFAAAVDEVARIEPGNSSEARDRQDVGGRIMMLCHQLDETWLEAKAERICGITDI